MDADDLVETVRSEHNTALSRLGSSKTLYADTGGEMREDAVLAAAATNATHAAETLGEWAEAGDGDLAAVFGTAAETAEEHATEIASRLGDFEPGAEPAVVATLDRYADGVERAGGLLGWLLVQDQKTTQLTGFFTGQADPQTASVFRGFGDDYETVLEETGEALAAGCDDPADWERAEAAAGRAVQAAYDEYVETLESMGVNPKPVC